MCFDEIVFRSPQGRSALLLWAVDARRRECRYYWGREQQGQYYPEIQKPPLRRGLERCRAPCADLLDPVSLQQVEAVVRLFGLQIGEVLRTGMFPSYTSEASCLRAVIATASLIPANKNPPINAASTAHKDS